MRGGRMWRKCRKCPLSVVRCPLADTHSFLVGNCPQGDITTDNGQRTTDKFSINPFAGEKILLPAGRRYGTMNHRQGLDCPSCSLSGRILGMKRWLLAVAAVLGPLVGLVSADYV